MVSEKMTGHKMIRHKLNKITTNYPEGDFLIKIKNASMAKNKEVTAPANNQIFALAEALKKYGFLDTVKKGEGQVTVTLAFKNKIPVIMNMKLISKPGLRVYMGVDELETKKGPSTYLVSTPKGILSLRDTIKQRVGGEVVVKVW